MSKEKKIEEIERLCEENGLKLAEVLREAKVPYSTVQNWKNKDPKPFETEKTIKDTIIKMASRKQTTE